MFYEHVFFHNANLSVPKSITSISCGDGGDDHLTGGTGIIDYIIGGGFEDYVEGNEGIDFVFGDHGEILLDDEPPYRLLYAVATEESCSPGDDTIILHDGDDFAVGGGGSDEVHGNDGSDVLVSEP